MIRTLAYGLPRLGPNREYKRLLEGFWSGSISREDFLEGLEALEALRLATYREQVDLYPAGELSLYDPMLDLAVALGLYPLDPGDLEGYYALARGKEALPLRKWFGTNYHYLVPRLPERPRYTPQPGWGLPYPVGRNQALKEGLPTLLGPYTLLRMAQNPPDRLGAHLEALTEAYVELVQPVRGRTVLLQEPALGLDGAEEDLPHLLAFYGTLAQEVSLVLLPYYLPPAPRVVEALATLPLRGLGVILAPGVSLPQVPKGTALVVEVVEGLGVWRTNLLALGEVLSPLAETGQEVWVAPKAPLYHLPWEVAEPLPGALAGRLAFARERLKELALLKAILLTRTTSQESPPSPEEETAFAQARAWYTPPPPWDFRPSPVPASRPPREERSKAQQNLALPLFPTTTIGSFPQTKELRDFRKRLRSRALDQTAYWLHIQEAIRANIRLQEELGLDVLVHGEPERSDMVEFFAERLEGFYPTQKGFVLSYGSRVWRPPILFAPPRRREPLVLRETLFAQSLTPKPVKAILTGPITLAAWSYLPQGVEFREAVIALAEALREEVKEVASHGIRVVQVDEPALLEKLPLKAKERPGYLALVGEAFLRVVGELPPEVQVHLHLCYSDYAALRPFLEVMDPDVVSLEGARQDPSFLQTLTGLSLGLGPGAFDVHSPLEVPAEEILTRLQAYLRYLPAERLWVNPDCGLKTRKPEEALANLKNMVEAAKRLRKAFGGSHAHGS
ncbi:5-methyltetrahydropteroyltriglutamate--homocysteine methyltransferase [Thermus thermophilus]|uniref:5-methyltetrahydropteroyltriglutamate--homocysteine S-methyltransferase n=3 Tax=Thermus TaxID=270 RepID=A0ABY7RPS7_9DEIN|nr:MULTISPECIES: 5-methyltetrahydropteroyltriglutamate--homocysteine S-methyltransferase [Thermus]QWK21543.1 MAG: 5-methyltetrahydropteroyltriglutamate--homocysteine S-methyltransferase [Thermus antranikianii]WCM39699.1 5-methyltetrahydropteroyltriglutamate--homocysteine S-methyltransferase [Thermus antranikianii]BDG19075.1 5-methyltetrahydropteroyltriglutamate--homocysteine methyltransferase [Thermus thermophilus]BDG21370.1 5-methyltetrahydropteroyltriglutamate--homocysteine methyltransferase 